MELRVRSTLHTLSELLRTRRISPAVENANSVDKLIRQAFTPKKRQRSHLVPVICEPVIKDRHSLPLITEGSVDTFERLIFKRPEEDSVPVPELTVRDITTDNLDRLGPDRLGPDN